MTDTTHTCDFDDSTAYLCDTCYVTGCGECMTDLGEARICKCCLDKEEKDCREAEEAALQQANESWYASFGDMPF